MSYVYEGEKLIKVTRQDNSFVTFEYTNIAPFGALNGAQELNVGAVITAVKDSLGKILESHTYDWQWRGTSSSRADGVEAVTITYPKSPEPIRTF